MPEQTITRIIVLISGSGTNLQALIDAVKNDTITSSQIVRVISNRKAAYGLIRAKEAGIPSTYHNLLTYKRRFANDDPNNNRAREAYDADLAQIVLKDQPEIVVCAGWMHVLTEKFLDPIKRMGVPVINLHPALPGQYNGANAIERAHRDWMAGKIDKTGAMIHYVIKEVDMGEPIIIQEIPFIKGVDEDIQRLEQRIHEVEHKIIVAGTCKALNKPIQSVSSTSA